jgi:hypothetical protein
MHKVLSEPQRSFRRRTPREAVQGVGEHRERNRGAVGLKTP